MQFLYGALMWGGGLALVYYGTRYALGLLFAILTSAPVIGLIVLFCIAVPIGFGWNFLRSTAGHEYLPFSYQERLLPFVSATDLQPTELPSGRDKLSFRVVNNSAYPITSAIVNCTFDTTINSGYEENMVVGLRHAVVEELEQRIFL